MTDFSYEQYNQILSDIINSQKQKDYSEITENTKEFVILRHDVEFSVIRAHKMAEIEYGRGVNSSYFFQIRSRAYNILAKQNRDMLNEIGEMGHRVGLHVHGEEIDNTDELRDMIESDITVMKNYTGLDVDRYSFHRPKAYMLKGNLCINGCINAYDKKYFHFIENAEENTVFKIKYIADSMHKWRYGFPDTEAFKKNDKIQILIHPDSWTELGGDALYNFKSLLGERHESDKVIFDSETKYFKDVKDEL